ncbi:glycosyltransferase family 32 protein, partial [Akkermansia sp.]|uniref:glycosyltransferase family 32 protein n=1 Tax=Akkermansia sp. TaxID=1872421 RepID=UPI003A864977
MHYCWFGSPVPEAVRQNVWKWKELNPDFEIIEWNESNIDVSLLNLAEDAWNRTNGFLGDVVRLQALVEHGGFYLDCDVELFQPLSRLPVDHRFTLKYMYDCALGTAFLYAPPQHPLCISLLRLHNEIRKE